LPKLKREHENVPSYFSRREMVMKLKDKVAIITGSILTVDGGVTLGY
jgi:hypothetical protein